VRDHGAAKESAAVALPKADGGISAGGQDPRSADCWSETLDLPDRVPSCGESNCPEGVALVMPYQTLPKMLSQIDLFANLPESVIEDLISVGVTFETSPGGTLVAQGSPSAGLQVVVEGSAEIEVNGVRRPAVGPGGYFGEISVIDGRGRSATVLAGEGGLKTFAVSPMNFSGLIDKYPELARSLLTALCARIRSLEALDPI
jgi:CRP/FNR family transcriptional regulator, cyclic AMP receptor protein